MNIFVFTPGSHEIEAVMYLTSLLTDQNISKKKKTDLISHKFLVNLHCLKFLEHWGYAPFDH